MFQARGPMHHFFRGRRGFGAWQGFGPRSARGNVKYEILSVLFDQPRHGYDIILEIEKRRGGFRPSPGSIYPALQMLEDDDMIAGTMIDGKRVYSITEKGREALAAQAERAAAGPADGDEALFAILADGARVFAGLKGAAKQIMLSRNPEVIRRSIEVLDRARREIYAILADEA